VDALGGEHGTHGDILAYALLGETQSSAASP
jgi:hypothetical protein